MRRRVVEPGQVLAIAARGQAGEPEGLRRYRVGQGKTGGECLPRGRYGLAIDVSCREDVRVIDTRVERFYRGVLPGLLRGAVRGAVAQRWVDLIRLIDELMAREDELYGSAVGWPLGELVAVFDEAAGALAREGNAAEVGLGEEFRRHAAALAEHAGCCRQGLVSVRWY